MKKVILLRHGKSSWDEPDLDDHDRPLAPRGQRASPVVGSWLAAKGHLPDIVLCSSARRTRETWQLVAEALPGGQDRDLSIEEALYHASPDGMLARIATLDDGVSTVMLVGHNPGLSSLARKLAGPKVRPGCARAFRHFPTAAAAIFTLPADRWQEIEFGQAAFVDFAKPRELEAVR